MSRPFKDLTGQTFNFLTANNRGEKKQNSFSVFWDCTCVCGKNVSVEGTRLLSGRIKSCGCQKTALLRDSNTRHGHCVDDSMSRTYSSWRSAINRCHNEKSNVFERYGGIGISVCERWRSSFDLFLLDMGERPKGTTLDRWPDKSGGYSPDNCRWATPSEQQNNLKNNRHVSVNGDTYTIREACTKYNLPYSSVRNKLNRHGKYIGQDGLLVEMV